MTASELMSILEPFGDSMVECRGDEDEGNWAIGGVDIMDYNGGEQTVVLRIS